MSPQLALLLYFIFLIFIFKIESIKKINIPKSSWIPTIWLMYCSSRSIVSWLNRNRVVMTNIDYTSGSPLDRNFLLALLIIGIIILIKRKIEWKKIFKDNIWIFFLFFYMAFSILWSDFKDVSFKRWIRALGDIIMVLIIYTDEEPFAVLDQIFRRCAYFFIPLSIIFTMKLFNGGIWDMQQRSHGFCF